MPACPKSRILDLATCRFLREHRECCLSVRPERENRFSSRPWGYQAIKQGCLVLYRSIFDVVRDFLHDEAFAGHDKILGKYLKPDLLIIDDMGMEATAETFGGMPLRDRHAPLQTRSTIMTSNRPLEDWGKLLSDVPSATAILDRFLHHAEIIPMNGRSYRLRNQAAQAAAAKEEKKATPRRKSQPRRQNPRAAQQKKPRIDAGTFAWPESASKSLLLANRVPPQNRRPRKDGFSSMAPVSEGRSEGHPAANSVVARYDPGHTQRCPASRPGTPANYGFLFLFPPFGDNQREDGFNCSAAGFEAHIGGWF